MAIDSSCFFDCANDFIADPDCSEVVLRNVISLAYYSVYHAALGLADRICQIPLSGLGGVSSHKSLSDFYLNIQHLNKGFVSILDKELRIGFRRIGGNLLRLHAQRVVADYQLTLDVSMTDAQDVLRLCQSVHDFLHSVNIRMNN